MSLASFAFRNSRGLLMTAVLLSLLGGLVLRSMPASILPDFPFPRLAVIVNSGDMAIQEMIPRVTRPLEGAASGVPGAKFVRSKTARGALELSVDFDWGTDMFEAFTRLNANVAALRASLPPQASVEVEWVNPSSFPILGYSVTSEKLSARDLQEIATLDLAPYLSRLKGVYRVLVQGGESREYQVLLKPEALSAAGITPDQVTSALNGANFVQSVGRFTRHYQGYLVLVDSQVHKPSDLLDVALTGAGGRPVRLRDVATISEGDEERQQVVTADGREAVLLSVLKQPGASGVEVSDEVKAALAEASTHLPEGVKIVSFYDEAELLRDSLASLRDSILIGALLALLVLLLFLRSWRMALVVFLCLPVTVLVSFLGLHLLHQSANLMTLGGLAVGLGLIIDDVVVTLENIFRHGELGKPARQAALDGSAEIQKPMIGSSLTAVAVFLPLAFLSGITGALFAPLSITLTLLLLVSVALAVTLVPLIASAMMPPKGAGEAGGKASAVGRLARAYERSLRGALRFPAPTLAGTLGVALVVLALVPSLPSGLMPEMDEGAFVLDYLAPPGTSLHATDQQVRVIEKELRVTPEVESYSRRTGLELGFFTTEPSRGDLMVKLKPRSQRKRSMSEVAEDVLSRCRAELPGMEMETVAPIADRVADIAGEPSPIEVKVFGDDPDELDRLAAKVKTIVESVKGTSESVHEVVSTGPELAVHVDPRRAGLLGVTPQEVARTLEISMLGAAETTAVSGERVVGVRVVYPKGLRETLQQIQQLPIINSKGARVPLSSIATFSVSQGAHEVTRENQKPVVLVKAVLHGRDLGSANREVARRIQREVKLAPGYSIQYGGLYATQQESFLSLITVLLVGILLVYLVTLYQYNRFGEPTALVVSAAFGLVGVVLALKLTGTFLNASSFTGGIMIFGMVLTNGIVLMDTIAAEHATGLPLEEAMVRAGQRRLRPVLMTASIAVLTLLPLALGLGSGAEMQKPLAIAVIGGLVVSPLFTLLLAPLLLFVLRRGR